MGDELARVLAVVGSGVWTAVGESRCDATAVQVDNVVIVVRILCQFGKQALDFHIHVPVVLVGVGSGENIVGELALPAPVFTVSKQWKILALRISAWDGRYLRPRRVDRSSFGQQVVDDLHVS